MDKLEQRVLELENALKAATVKFREVFEANNGKVTAIKIPVGAKLMWGQFESKKAAYKYLINNAEINMKASKIYVKNIEENIRKEEAKLLNLKQKLKNIK